MSIVISNISESKGVPYLPHGEEGVQHYGVFLNQIPLVEYEHNTEGGMAACLAKAAEALSEVDIDQAIDEHKVGQMFLLKELLKSEGSN